MAFAEWIDVRTGVVTTGLLSLTAYVGKVWGDKIVAYVATPLGLCRATKANTRAIGELRTDAAFMRDENRMILDQFKVAYAYTDAKGNVLEVSDAWVRMSGCPRDKAMNDGWIPFIRPSDQKAVTEQFFEQVNSKRPRPFSIDFQFVKSRAVIRSTVEPLRDRTGRVVGFRGMHTVLHADPLEDEHA